MTVKTNMLVSTGNRDELKSLFRKLNADTIPLWGQMKPQQMVEHLVDAVEYTNGKKFTGSDVSAEEAAVKKQRWLFTDQRIPKNLVLGTLPDEYRFAGLPEAIEQLMTELAGFDDYFKTPGAMAIQPAYGQLNYEEWLIWHGKHFEHHLRQFGLLAE